MKYFCLLLVLGLNAVRADKINIDTLVDHGFKTVNQKLVTNGITMAKLPEGLPIPNVSYSNAMYVGLDSLTRTGTCSVEYQNSDITFDLHYGLRLLAVVFGRLNIGQDQMSALLRIRDNSVGLRFTMHTEDICSVSLEDLKVERLSWVELGASHPQYEGLDLEEFFHYQVLFSLNKLLKDQKSNIEKGLQILCHINHGDHSEHASMALLTIFENLVNQE